MADKFYPKSNLPIRRTVELLPVVFQSETNDKFLSGVLDPLVQPGVLEKITGFIGRRYGKTYNGNDVYIDTDETLRSRYQLEPGIVLKNHGNVENFYDYIDFKNQLKFFGNDNDRDDDITSQEHYTWKPPITWDKFINYREYFWVPNGPPSIPIFGQSANVVSTYKVVLGATKNSFVFTPDSYTNNPTITLYRGQTYKFRINAPTEGFSIRTNYDTGSLLFQSFTFYRAGTLVVYDSKLWRAKRDVLPSDGSSITLDSQDWEYLEPASSGNALEYNNGIVNNGIENGVLTFTVPYDAPDVLYYQGLITPDCFGRFVISDIEENTFLNVDKDIIGKSTYTSSNGIELSNGMVLEFRGNISPAKYSSETWLVEGVGEAITLTKFVDLIVPVLTTDVPEITFDNAGFDTEPFDDATAYPTYKDYITISRDSVDRNAWSRYNRWFHRSVLEKSYQLRNQDFFASESSRAKRPIIEFKSNLQLFNFGSIAKDTVDYIDDFTTDVLSNIEGSSGYNIDGEFVFEGARILVVADTDSLVNNRIYQVNFITHNGNRQIHLQETDDSDSKINESVLVRRGNRNAGKMFHYNGSQWKLSQEKTKVNQSPRFDAFDNDGISFSDPLMYPTNDFIGTKILSYKEGNGKVDPELGFKISYLNIDNVGDIQFDWNWETDIVNYTVNRTPQLIKISTGYYKINPDTIYENGWITMSNDFIQPIIDSQVIKTETNVIEFNTIDWDNVSQEILLNIYINDQRYLGNYTRDRNTFTFPDNFKFNDIVALKIIADVEPKEGFYEIPIGLEKNPLNAELKSFTLGQAIDHITTALEFESSLIGTIPGNSNLRDISNYQQHAKRFLKHSGLTPLAMLLLCDKTHNIIKSLQYSKKAYTDFKNNFINRSIEIDYNDNVADFVDDIINSLTKTKNQDSAFYDSDMIGAGAYTKLIYEVEDIGIKTFSLSEKFDLNTLSKKAVYVYLNNQQLLNTIDYEFNSVFGFVSLKINLNVNDKIEIREYISTSTNHIPPTPTSLGLYKKYTPKKFIDDTYTEPREVIQGHDGSIVSTYGDFRDDLLLELELRIYNNIKQQYREDIFDIDKVVGGYYGIGLYTKSQLDSIVDQEFLKWVQNTNINYTLNEYFDSENSFTYTYSNMTDPTKSVNLPGYWRGVYKWFYDTDRPHRCPWEMLGFSEEPDWWESVYGPAPYTKNNLILWEDLRDGVIRQGSRSGRHDRYKRNSLLDHIPVDGDGNLLSPLESGLAQDFSLINNKGSFVLGDIAPVEYAWRSSSEWPFAVAIAMCLMKPFEFIPDSYDRSITDVNIIDQTVNNLTRVFSNIQDISLKNSTDPSSGLVKYLIAYIKSLGISTESINNKLASLDVALSYRMSGFVDQQQQKFLLDSKSPSATSSSIYIPPENYDIVFNISSPITSISYSGVILEKTEGGWLATGYDDGNPFFNFHQPLPSQRDPIISVGGVSETFVDWSENKVFTNGTLVRYSNDFYRALKTHNSGTVFTTELWQKLGDIPKIGAVEASRRRTFNTLSVKKLSYGTKFTNIQQVVDFLLGYESYLKSVGFVFDRYDPTNAVSQDWLTASKEFMFWTKHNWEIGSLISLSPAAQKVNITVPIGVVDNILDSFYDYQVLKGDGKPLQPRFLNVNRQFQNVIVETTNTTDGIYFLKLNYVLKEHVTIFDDRTVFNDIIYDKTTGYRQGRIKLQGFRTVDWDGDYTSPGFLFDNVNIQIWQPFVDYKLGDIVAYKSFNWVSLRNQLGTETFNETFWSRLDTTPSKQLIPNFDYKINQFSDYFEVSSEGINQSQRELARHTIGYQQRNYLQNLAEDPVMQFQLYQGFIRDKGTANSLNKVFGKLSRSGSDSITLNEEWAFLLGRIGGTDQIKEIELQIEKNKIELNPQLFLIEESENSVRIDQNYRLTAVDFTVSPVPFTTEIFAKSLDTSPTRTAGYVAGGQYEHTIATRDDLKQLDIATVDENDHIWITFDSDSWNVLRLNELLSLFITNINRTDDTAVEITFNRRHSFAINDYIGFREVINLTGFYKIVNITNDSIFVEVDADALDPEIDSSTNINPQILTECRYDNYQTIVPGEAALLKNKSRVFVDNNGTNLWEVVEKNKQYIAKLISDYGTTTPLRTGEKVLYDNINKQVIVSIPGSSIIIVYAEASSGLQLKQIISPPTGFFDTVMGSFGNKMALSPDGKYLIVGSSEASGVRSNFKGEWASDAFYQQDDVVLYAGQLFKAINANTVVGDGSTDLAVNTDDWELATNIPALASGRSEGLYQQGMISIYEFTNGRFSINSSFVSPRPADNEKFGSEISVSLSGSSYYMAVSAVGSSNSTGRVYLYKNTGTGWNHLENNNYKGIYNSGSVYYSGDIVWQAAQDPIAEGVRGNLWTNLDDSTVDGSTLSIDSLGWLKVSDISTNCSLPTNIAIEDDGSTLEFATTGLLTDMQMAEIIKQGDQFGFSMAMNKDGSILVIGAPYSDGQYFANYRGVWRPDVEYIEGEVVRHLGSIGESYQYYRLGDAFLGPDSTYRSFNEDPSDSVNWIQVSDSTTQASGKIFVYKRSAGDVYNLTQMINAGSLSSFTDIDSGLVISTGDQFGFAMDIDASGNILTVSSPKADINYQDQGSVFVLGLDISTTEFRIKQKLESFEKYPNEYFGYGLSLSPDGAKIAVGARNAYNVAQVNFDILKNTSFDNNRTSFYTAQGFTGGVYIFDKKDQTFFLTEKLQEVFSPDESFGYSVDCFGSYVLVGSPTYREPVQHANNLIAFEGPTIGNVRLFKKSENVSSWTLLAQESPTVDIRKIQHIELYDNINNQKIQDLDYIDPAKFKILNAAEQEIKYKTAYDPAVYTIGSDEVVVDTAIAWFEKNVGKLWWDVSKAKFFYAEQGDYAYRLGNWNQLVQGASIDIYEWVETPLLPSEWAALADTNEGIAEGISGQPLYPNNDVYSLKQVFSTSNDAILENKYYYWVKNKRVRPANMPDRNKSAAEVASLITNPTGSGTAFLSIIDSNKFVAHNFQSVISSDTALINFNLRNDLNLLNPIHREYQLLTEGISDSLPSVQLENKWIDSLVGNDTAGNRVPDEDLPTKQKYGIQFRPRQSMFVDRITALRLAVSHINDILSKQPFVDLIDLSTLNSKDEEPSEILQLFDVAVDTEIDLQNVGTVRIKQAKLQANLVDGELDTIEIIDAGFGYRTVPLVEIEGDGSGAKASVTLDNQGRIASVSVNARGKKYSVINAIVRNFSVLVKTDSTINNFWSIYAWDDTRKVFFRSRSQAFDTSKYWTYIDWWAEGYSINSRITIELNTVFDEPTIIILVGDLIRVKEYGSGGWAVFEKISDTGEIFNDRFILVGRKNGTLQLNQSLYDTTIFGIGFDNTQSFDTTTYDINNSLELRNILKSVKEDIFVGEYAVEYNKLFFSSIRYALHEQPYVDWVFKSSFINATHNIGNLEQKNNYKNDNLESYQEYIHEVKPFRTTVREYISKYNNNEPAPTILTDFDLPPTYSAIDGKIVPITAERSELQQYPFKWWTDNNGYSIAAIEVYVDGSEYTSPPKVLIEGNGTGAQAQAFINNGRVSGINVIDGGKGYTKSPTITLIGGNPTTAIRAKAVATLGDSKVRTFDMKIKFDRTNKIGDYLNYTQSETFTANGFSAVFELNYAPSRDKTKITILKNKQVVLNSDYSISLFYSDNDSFALLRGKIIFTQAPAAGDIIEIQYDKNIELFNAVNRIDRFYNPTAGMLGKELNQLMTGVDFGGVQIQGTTFDVTGGWDALPWFTDNWDSVEPSSDYYYVVNVEDLVDSSKIYSIGEIIDYRGKLYQALKQNVDSNGSVIIPTINSDWEEYWEILHVVLPFTPAEGQEITIYWKKFSQNYPRNIDTLGDPLVNPVVVINPEVDFLPQVRIDDPAYNNSVDSSSSINPEAQMPTFVGDGETNRIDIGSYISARTGDIIIFRPIESDGSVTITDDNLLDTKLSGGTLSAIDSIYVNATGTIAEEIAITGGKFIEPDHVPSPEENIPGQVLDSVSIKVYQSTISGAAPLQSKIIFGDGAQTDFDIGQTILENKSVIVYINKIKKIFDLDYTIDFQTNTVDFISAPTAGSLIEILSIGLGGLGLLDYQEFEADGATNLFLTSANYDDTASVFVTVNGNVIDVGFRNSTDVVDAVGKTLVEFAGFPASGDIVKIVCLEASADVDSSGLSIIKLNTQTVYYEGSTRSFDLEDFVELSRGTARNSMIVEVDGKVLKGSDTVYAVYDGTNNVFTLGLDPLESPGSILPSNIRVFVNNILKTFITDYTFDGPTKVLSIYPSVLNEGDIIKIQNDLRAEYRIEGANVIIDNAYPMSSIDETDNVEITITWFSEYPSLDIVSDQKSGGKVQYQLSRAPISASYVWVYKNGIRLTQDQDYYVSIPRNVVYIDLDTVSTDDIKIISFTADTFKLPSAYEIHKDMLNIYHYKRFSKSDVLLTKDLNYYDTTIEVNDSSNLSNPIASRNLPGILWISGERIEYMIKTGNVLSQLRRGTQGTSIKELYSAGTAVVDVGYEENIPYNENQIRTDFFSDGSTLLVGPLDFVPNKATRTSWSRNTIPVEYGPCDQIEIFAAGKRLRKDPLTVWDEANGAASPEADEIIEAEFSVNGTSSYIRLTTALPAGTRITVIKRTGRIWYERGETTASAGIALIDNDTPIAKFIAQKSTSLPE